MTRDTIKYYNTTMIGQSVTIVMGGGYGYVMVSTSGDDKHIVIHDLRVHPSAQRKGLGRKLLDEAIWEAREMGAVSVIVAAESGSWQKSWYERHGFDEKGEADSFPGYVILEKTL